MKRYAISLQVIGLESESGKHIDDVKIWQGDMQEVQVTEEYLRDADIPFSLGEHLEAFIRDEIAKYEGEDV